jgi:hypothetical protein
LVDNYYGILGSLAVWICVVLKLNTTFGLFQLAGLLIEKPFGLRTGYFTLSGVCSIAVAIYFHLWWYVLTYFDSFNIVCVYFTH